MKKMTQELADKVLNCPMCRDTNDAEAGSVREYLVALATTVWREGEGFSGKRPFGNSDWDDEVYIALIGGGVVKGSLDSDGCIDSCDTNAAHKLVAAASNYI